MEKLSGKVRFKIAESGVNFKENTSDVSFDRNEIRKVIEKVKVRQELHKIENLKYDFLLGDIAYAEEHNFFEQIKMTETDRLKEIFRMSLPQEFIEVMPTRVSSIILSKVDLSRRVRIILCFKKEKRRIVLDHFDNHEPKIAMILRQEISRFEKDQILWHSFSLKQKILKKIFLRLLKKNSAKMMYFSL